MSATIQVITFDLDDTLWDVQPTLIAAEQEQRDWLIKHRPGTIEHYSHEALWQFKQSLWQRHPELAHHISHMRRQMLYELQLAAGYDEDEARSGAATAFDIFLARRHQVVLYEEALGVLHSLSRRYTLGALTNGNADIYKTDAGEYFDFALLAENIGASKPAPAMFIAALQRTAVHPNCMVHVGDHPKHDILAAQALGIHTVWMNSQRLDWPGEDGTPEREISNLSQLPEAIANIEHSRHA